MLIFSVSFQTLTEIRKVKRRQNYRDAQGHSDTCARSPHSNTVDQNSEDTKDTRVSAGSRRISTVIPKNWSFRQNCQPRETFVVPNPDVGTRLRPNTERKQDQRGILKSRDTRQVHNKRRVEVDCQHRDSLKEDVCSCLACPKTFLDFDHSGRDTSMSFVFHTHDLTNIIRKRLVLQQSVERDLHLLMG